MAKLPIIAVYIISSHMYIYIEREREKEHYTIFFYYFFFFIPSNPYILNKVGETDPVLPAEHFTASNCITQLDWELLRK